jgi:hypothetical protein
MSLVEGPINFNALAIRAGAGALLVLPVIAGLFARQAVAQTYPNSLIRIIVPYAAGGVTDSLARIIGAPVAEAVCSRSFRRVRVRCSACRPAPTRSRTGTPSA